MSLGFFLTSSTECWLPSLGPGSLDLHVPLVDQVEQIRDVRGGAPVDRQVAQVREQVVVEVAAVTVQGGRRFARFLAANHISSHSASVMPRWRSAWTPRRRRTC